MTSPFVAAYLILVLLLGVGAVARVYYGLLRAARRNRKRIHERKRFDALQSETPLEDPYEEAKARALESVDHQFTVTRRALVPLVLLITALALAIPFLGNIPAALVSVLVASMTVVLGVAARPFLDNAIAGLVISHSRLFNLGDTVIVDDLYGSIEDITSTHTTIKLWDWRRYVVPNSRMLQSNVVNYSLFDRFVWASVEFWVGYDADLDQVKAIAKEAARKSKRFAAYEDPVFWVLGMERDAVRCLVAAWADTPSDAWGLTHDARTSIVMGLRQAGIWTRAPHRVDFGPNLPEGPIGIRPEAGR